MTNSIATAGNTKGGSITLPLTSCLTGLDSSVLQIKTKIVSSHTADSKPVKQEVNCTAILPPLAFPAVAVLLVIGKQSFFNLLFCKGEPVMDFHSLVS